MILESGWGTIVSACKQYYGRTHGYRAGTGTNRVQTSHAPSSSKCCLSLAYVANSALIFFFLKKPPPPEIYPLPHHAALPIPQGRMPPLEARGRPFTRVRIPRRAGGGEPL